MSNPENETPAEQPAAKRERVDREGEPLDNTFVASTCAFCGSPLNDERHCAAVCEASRHADARAQTARVERIDE